MKTLTIQIGDDTVTIRPVPRSRLGVLSEKLLQLQAIWIEEEFSTGDTLARPDAWALVKEVWAMLPIAATPDACLSEVALGKLDSDYEQLAKIFLGDPSEAWQQEGDIGTFNTDAFKGCELWALHEVSPRKKLLRADELRREKSRTETSPPKTSRSKPRATSTPTSSPTSSTALAKSA